MSLDRTLIREDLVTRLLNNTSVSDKVFNWRVTPFKDPELPAIVIKAPDERSAKKSAGTTPRFQSELTLQIEIHAFGTTEKVVADQLDAINEEIETVVFKSPTWSKEFESWASYDTKVELNHESNKIRGLAIMLLDVKYQRSFPPTVPDELTNIHVDVDALDPSDPNLQTPGPDGRLEASADWPIDQ